MFLSFDEVVPAKRWLADLADDVATTAEVTAFNELFKSVGRRHHGRPGVVEATWLNVAFTHRGLEWLGAAGTSEFPPEFKDGMAERAATIGDRGASAPARWIEPFRDPRAREEVHALLLLASDSQERLGCELERRKEDAEQAGLRVVYVQHGRVRPELPGHEHFGFKDGVSQPGITGYTPNRAADPHKGDPGQDLVFPGEFVLGYPRMRRPESPVSAGCPEGPVSEGDADFDQPGEVARSGPGWTVNGSYLVFRRLRQDVPAFRSFVAELARTQGITEDLAGAKLVGRYASGAPLERTADQAPDFDPQAADPYRADPSILGRDKINNFEYGADASGEIVPRAAHIRKVYGRDEATPGGGEGDTQTHRLLRRGIPFGQSYDHRDAADDDFPNDRGLLFLCYQASIAEQFEFVQRCWVGNRDFPQPGDGVDPIIWQGGGPRDFSLPGCRHPMVCAVPHVVTTTAGEYFFQPSISALHVLAGD